MSRIDGRSRRLRHAISFAMALLAAAALVVTMVFAVRAQGEQTVTPAQVLVEGEIGGVVTRTVMLRLPSTATNLRFVAQDLAANSGATTLPATAIGAELPPIGALASGVTTSTVTAVVPMTVTVNLAEAQAGSYSGQALLLYLNSPAAGAPEQQVEAPLAFSVSVKQPWTWPALVLVIGVLIGMALTYYRDYLRPRDQVLARLGEVQHRLAADPELAAPAEAGGAASSAARAGRGRDFRTAVESSVNAALAALRDGEGEQAKSYTRQAEQTLDLWQQQRPNWLAALATRDELLESIPAVSSSVYLTAVRRALIAATSKSITTFLAPSQPPASWQSCVDSLVAELDKLRSYLQDHAELTSQVTEATWKVKAAGLEAGERTAKLSELAAVEHELNTVDPVSDSSAPNKLASLSQRVEAVTANLPAPKGGVSLEAAAMDASGSDSAGNLLAWLSNLHMPTLAELGRDKGPRLRLAAFAWGSVILALVLLVLVGFNELYEKNATFGAVWLTDYLGLLAWGFGAEATRASVTSLVQGWGLMRAG